MKHGNLLTQILCVAAVGSVTALAQPATAQGITWNARYFTFNMGGDGGGQLQLAHNVNDNKIYMEGFNFNQTASASELLITGRWGAPLPQFTAIANITMLLGASPPPSGEPAGNNGLGLGSAGDAQYKWIQSYNGPLVLNSWGNNVGIGLTNPAYRFDVNGDSNTRGVCRANSFAVNSDSRFKTDVHTFDHALDTVLNLHGVTFDWNRNEWKEKNFPAGHQVGFIAQEVEKVLPELVTTDTQGYKAVAYQNVVPVLVEAMKAQQAQIEALKAEKASYQTTLEKLSARMVALENLNRLQQK